MISNEKKSREIFLKLARKMTAVEKFKTIYSFGQKKENIYNFSLNTAIPSSL